MDSETNTCNFCRAETQVVRQYLHAKNKPMVGDGFAYIYYCKDCGLLEDVIRNSCEIHEICEKCGFPEVKGKKLKSQCVYKNEDCEKCLHKCKNCDEAGHSLLACITKKCSQCVFENNNGICDNKHCANNKRELLTTDEDIYSKINSFYEIDGVNVNNTILVARKLLSIYGYDQNIVERLRPLFIFLDRHKEKLCKK